MGTEAFTALSTGRSERALSSGSWSAQSSNALRAHKSLGFSFLHLCSGGVGV